MGTRIVFQDDKDKQWVSSYSRSVIAAIGEEAKVNQIVITSAMRTSEEQASAMYKNEQLRIHYADAVAADKKLLRDYAKNPKTPNATIDAVKARVNRNQGLVNTNTVSYRPPGAKVQAVATKNITTATADTTEADLCAHTLTEMLEMIDKVGLVNVTNHAGRFGLEVLDVGIKRYGAEERDRLEKAIRRRLGAIVYRFGNPNPAKNNRYEFRDGKCFHLEILQPGDYERSASTASIA